MWKKLTSPKPGDRVRFTADWLKSTGQTTGDAPQMRGLVERVYHHPSRCTVWWGGAEQWTVLACNLEKEEEGD